MSTGRGRATGVHVALLVLAGVLAADSFAGGRLVLGPAALLVVVLAGLLGLWSAPAPATATAAVAVVLLVAANQHAEPGRYAPADDAVFYVLAVGGPVLAGALARVRADQVRRLRALAAERDRQRADAITTARLEERNRLDVAVTRALMQRIGAIVVHTAGADRSPAQLDEALPRIERAGRDVLDDLRSALGSLRAEAPTGSPPAPEAATPPTPTAPLDRRDVLVGAGGVPLAVEVLISPSLHPHHLVAAVALAAVCGVPLAWRRRRPVTSAAGCLLAVGVLNAWLVPIRPSVTALLLLSLVPFALGAHIRGRRRVAGVALLLAAGAVVARGSTLSPSDGLLPTTAWVVLAYAAGWAVSRHALGAVRLEALLAEVEAGHPSALRRAVAEQRQHVARELHDNVAHAMTVLCLHAEAAQRSPDPAEVHASVQHVERAAREAMSRLRTALPVLEADQDRQEARTSREDLAGEVRTFAAALGLRPAVEVGGPLVRDAELVRRIVREALVNVSRHAPGADAWVRVTDSGPPAGSVLVEVGNGPSTGRPFEGGSGNGLTGLGELVGRRDGALTHGATEGGGFLVTAVLPARRPVTT